MCEDHRDKPWGEESDRADGLPLWWRWCAVPGAPIGPLAFCIESDPRLLAEILIIFPPSSLALAKACVVLDEFDCAYEF